MNRADAIRKIKACARRAAVLRPMMRINEGECIPRGYGIAWRDFLRRQCIVAPMPLNLLLAWARTLSYAMAHPHSMFLMNRVDALRHEYARGSRRVACSSDMEG